MEALVKGQKEEKKPTAGTKPKEVTVSENVERFQSRLADRLDAKVQISSNNKGKGKIVINFGSEKHLDKIIDFIDQLDA